MKFSDAYNLNNAKHDVLNFADSVFYKDVHSYCEALNKYLIDNNKTVKIDNEFILHNIEIFYGKYSISLSEKQKQNLNKLWMKDVYMILYPYQPNLFPSVSVIAPFFLMDLIQKIMFEVYKKNVLPVYLIIDYDNAFDKRFQGGYIPSLRTGNAKLNLKYNTKMHKNDVMFSVPLPNIAFLDNWIKGMVDESNRIDKFLNTLGLATEKAMTIANALKKIYKSSNYFTEFNFKLLHYIVVDCFDLGVLFLEGHPAYKLSDGYCLKELKNICDHKYEIKNSFNSFVSFCQKNNFSRTLQDGSILELAWKYKKICKQRCKDSIDCFNDCIPDYFFPNVLADYLLDYLFYHKCGGIGYYKQMEATICSDIILKEAFFIEPCPQYLTNVSIDISDFDPQFILSLKNAFDDDFVNRYLENCLDSHCSILYYLIIFDIKKLKKIIYSKGEFYETFNTYN